MEGLSFGARLKLAWQVLFDPVAAARLSSPVPAPPPPSPTPATPLAPTPPPPPERVHASGLALLAALQREGRLVDFLQQEVTGFSDADVGAAARVIHEGCRRVLHQWVDLEPAITESEGSSLTLPPGFDAQRIRLTGQVTGQPPFYGTVRHHGWVASKVRFPTLSDSLDPRVLAAAEIELP